MTPKVLSLARVLATGWILAFAARATTVPQLSFEKLTDASELIVSGTVTTSWTAWDSEHKYIWTHYSLSVSSVHKGAPGSSVEFAEPGGAVGPAVMSIAGVVTYSPGDHVAIFLARMPNGYLRTAGWAQGKYLLDSSGRLHAAAVPGDETIVATGASPVAVSSLRSLEGTTMGEFAQRVAAHVRGTQSRGRLQ